MDGGDEGQTCSLRTTFSSWDMSGPTWAGCSGGRRFASDFATFIGSLVGESLASRRVRCRRPPDAEMSARGERERQNASVYIVRVAGGCAHCRGCHLILCAGCVEQGGGADSHSIRMVGGLYLSANRFSSTAPFGVATIRSGESGGTYVHAPFS